MSCPDNWDLCFCQNKKFEKFRGKGLIDLVSPLKSAVRHRKLQPSFVIQLKLKVHGILDIRRPHLGFREKFLVSVRRETRRCEFLRKFFSSGSRLHNALQGFRNIYFALNCSLCEFPFRRQWMNFLLTTSKYKRRNNLYDKSLLVVFLF